MRLKIAFISVLSLAITGCASFRSYSLPVVAPSDIAFNSTQKPKVFSRWSIETNSKMTNDQMKAAGAAVHKKYFDDAITKSGCCILVEGPTEADIVVDGKAVAENNPAAMIPAFITGFSLYTIPSWVTVKAHIKVEAKKASQTKKYALQDSMTMVQWLPLVVLMPFKNNPIKEGKAVDENVYNNLIYRMKRDGLLQ